MTKEEALNKIIEYCKNGSKTPVSDFCRIPCSVCPFNDDNCENVIADVLTERLIKAEEHQETNLEHFRGNVVFIESGGVIHINLKNGWEKSYSDDKSVIDWILLPYEPPKYKLTQFEYDLLDSANPTWAHENNNTELCDFGYLTRLIDKGYFKGFPTDVPIRDILADCEVINE